MPVSLSEEEGGQRDLLIGWLVLISESGLVIHSEVSNLLDILILLPKECYEFLL